MIAMRAFARNKEISAKHAREIGAVLRGMSIIRAKKYLQSVVELKQAVPFKRYNKEVPHRRGMASGRYPRKAAAEIIKILDSAKANAVQKGHAEEDLIIDEFITSRGRFKRAYGAARALGRKGNRRSRTATIEVRLKLSKTPVGKPEAPKKEVLKKEEPKKENKVKEAKVEEQPETEKPKEEEKVEKWLQKQR